MQPQTKAVAACAAVAVGNLGLLFLLKAFPFPNHWAQLTAGACAMGLHGWCAWEIVRTLKGFSALAGAEAISAKEELWREARQVSESRKSRGARRRRARRLASD